ncbi:restriction endonuclease [Elizabethkingia anophelis]|uniref:restriction endonuclease n=1 Tax=Elizabethkingia anophelis TaxID=1117645 RepID=UPI000C6C9D42|nr:restriction endonuclease [Elizabethkingia anophelis]PKR30019.1 restriction endonuclease [Elizabethkingia anophelis]PKR33740.1 restriction endonuclease [Elizabethkingia anophelis]PRQ82691.1 restriction endonuclease [Elizabethkingia anophelis]
MHQELPKFHETFNPILEILSNGEVIHTRVMQKRVIEKYYAHLPKELLEETTKSGENLINNRIAWGKSYLKKGGYIHYPSRGNVQITEKGIAQKTHLSLNSLEQESSLMDFYQTENDKKSTEIKKISNASPQDLIDEGFNQIERETKNELLEKLKEIDPYYFEKVILILLKKMGYGDFIETTKSSDGGIDGVINEDKLGLDKIYIQAKRFTENKVREKDIRNFIGAMSGDTNKGVFVTTSLFDKGAEEKAKNAHHKIILIDGNKLVDLMHEYNVGVQIKATYEVKHLDEDFFVEQ